MRFAADRKEVAGDVIRVSLNDTIQNTDLTPTFVIRIRHLYKDAA